MATRILLLTQWFDPEPTFKGIVFARELVRQGFSVEVVTGFPNYPGGKLYPGYRIKLLHREEVDGVRITRIPLYPSHDQSSIKRSLNYLSFALSAFIYLLIARRPDVIYAYQPPLTVGVTASIIRFFRSIPVVYDIQDMWPDTLKATGMVSNKHILNIIGIVCRWVYRNVDHLVVLSPGFKRLLEREGVPENRIDVIYNWADEVSLTTSRGALPTSFPQEDRFRIVFAGNMGKAQGLETVLDAAVLLQEKKSRVHFVLVGGGVELNRLKEITNDRKISNVVFLPPVPMAEIGAVLNAADVLLVHLRKNPLFEITIPSKTQAYMAVGKPVLMAVNGDAASLVKQSEGGIVVDPEDAVALAAAADSLANLSRTQLELLGSKAKQYYYQYLATRVGTERFSAIFRRLG